MAMFVDFQWAQLNFHWEWASQDGVDLGVSWPIPSGLASRHWNTSNEHFWL